MRSVAMAPEIAKRSKNCAGPEYKAIRRTRERNSVEVEIADGLFNGLIFRLFQPLRKFAREKIFFGPLGLNREAEFFFDSIVVLAEQAGGVIEVDRRRALGGFMGKDGAHFDVHSELGLAARTLDQDRFVGVFCHGGILTPIEVAGLVGGGPRRRATAARLSSNKKRALVTRAREELAGYLVFRLVRVFRPWPSPAKAAVRAGV